MQHFKPTSALFFQASYLFFILSPEIASHFTNPLSAPPAACAGDMNSPTTFFKVFFLSRHTETTNLFWQKTLQTLEKLLRHKFGKKCQLIWKIPMSERWSERWSEREREIGNCSSGYLPVALQSFLRLFAIVFYLLLGTLQSRMQSPCQLQLPHLHFKL